MRKKFTVFLGLAFCFTFGVASVSAESADLDTPFEVIDTAQYLDLLKADQSIETKGDKKPAETAAPQVKGADKTTVATDLGSLLVKYTVPYAVKDIEDEQIEVSQLLTDTQKESLSTALNNRLQEITMIYQDSSLMTDEKVVRIDGVKEIYRQDVDKVLTADQVDKVKMIRSKIDDLVFERNDIKTVLTSDLTDEQKPVIETLLKKRRSMVKSVWEDKTLPLVKKQSKIQGIRDAFAQAISKHCTPDQRIMLNLPEPQAVKKEVKQPTSAYDARASWRRGNI